MAVQIAVSELPELGLERREYIDPEHFALELERFWRPGWRFVCHESEIAARGQYVRYDLTGDSVVVVRGEQGAVHALHNVCRHRGSPVVGDESGVCRGRFVCPYHGWSYDLPGRGRATRHPLERLRTRPVHERLEAANRVFTQVYRDAMRG